MGLLSPACGVAAKDWAADIFIQASFCVCLSRGTEDSNTFMLDSLSDVVIWVLVTIVSLFLLLENCNC